MSLAMDSKMLNVVETVASSVIKPAEVVGIDIGPLIDALMQFLLQLLQDCPKSELQRAAEQAARRPLIRMFWRARINKRLPAMVVNSLPDASADLLTAGAALSPAQWAALGE